jgi:hypothetical protein
VDLAAYRVDTLPGSVADNAGCGVRRGVDAPGIRRHRWMHAVSKLAPELVADDADRDGIAEDALAAPCAGGVQSGCRDNCPGRFNPDQADADADGAGDLCDAECAGFGGAISITSLSAAQGVPDAPIQIDGTNFGPAAQAWFGDERATVTASSSTQVSARVPLVPVGTSVAVEVRNPEGCSAASGSPFTVTGNGGGGGGCGLLGADALLVLALLRKVKPRRNRGAGAR